MLPRVLHALLLPDRLIPRPDLDQLDYQLPHSLLNLLIINVILALLILLYVVLTFVILVGLEGAIGQ